MIDNPYDEGLFNFEYGYYEDGVDNRFNEDTELHSTIVKLNDRVLELEKEVDRSDKLLTFAVYHMTDEQYSKFLEYESEVHSE